LKALVVGLGSIARRHIRNLAAIDAEIEIAVWRQHSRSADLQDLAPMISQVVFSAEEALVWRPDIALLTNPASLHVETGLTLAREGVHLFVEKPLSNTLKNIDLLLEVCRERALTLMVGYHLRFYTPLSIMHQALAKGHIGRPMFLRAEVGQFLPDWRPDIDYRQAVSARKELGGGVVMELSHELDYARWLLGEVETVSAHIGKLSDLQLDVEDTAEIVLQFASGAIGSIHMDMVQRELVRNCRICGTEGTLVWDWNAHRVQLYSAATRSWQDLCNEPDFEPNAMYVAELRHFLGCIRDRQKPLVDGAEGHRVLEVILAVKEAARAGQKVEI
jgi:predicted dehydrogenase